MNTRKSNMVTAADIMQRDVIVVYDSDSLQTAMQAMTENHVTGLPVVNTKGKCVGVITSSDIMNYEQEHSEFISEANADMARHFNPESGQWESVRITSFALEEFGEVRVDEVMSPDLVFVEPTSSILEVAQKMRDQRIHRVLVLSTDYRLNGIISAFDFVRLYADSK